MEGRGAGIKGGEGGRRGSGEGEREMHVVLHVSVLSILCRSIAVSSNEATRRIQERERGARRGDADLPQSGELGSRERVQESRSGHATQLSGLSASCQSSRNELQQWELEAPLVLRRASVSTRSCRR